MFCLTSLKSLQARLEREFNLSLITTAPTVVYHCITTKGETIECSNPADIPAPANRRAILEPFVKMEVITPKEYVGMLMELCQTRRGTSTSSHFVFFHMKFNMSGTL